MELSAERCLAAPATKRPNRLACDDPLLTATEAAAESGRAISTFWRDVKLGTLPAAIYVLPRAPRWRRSELRAAIEACRGGKAGEVATEELSTAIDVRRRTEGSLT